MNYELIQMLRCGFACATFRLLAAANLFRIKDIQRSAELAISRHLAVISYHVADILARVLLQRRLYPFR